MESKLSKLYFKKLVMLKLFHQNTLQVCAHTFMLYWMLISIVFSHYKSRIFFKKPSWGFKLQLDFPFSYDRETSVEFAIWQCLALLIVLFLKNCMGMCFGKKIMINKIIVNVMLQRIQNFDPVVGEDYFWNIRIFSLTF